MGMRNSVAMLGGGWEPAMQYLAYDRRGGGQIDRGLAADESAEALKASLRPV